MSVTILPLIQSATITSAMASYWAASGYTRIDALTLYNPIGNAAELVNIEWVPAGGSAGTGNRISSHNCLPGETFSVYGLIGQTFAPGDKLYAQGATGGLVNMFASGTVTS